MTEKIITDCDICGREFEWTSEFGPICATCSAKLGGCVSNSQKRRVKHQLSQRKRDKQWEDE